MVVCSVCGMSYADDDISEGICNDCWDDEYPPIEPMPKKRKFDDER